MPKILVEFFGIPRERAGVAEIKVTAADLRDVFAALRDRLPGFATACLDGDQLKSDYIAGIDGRVLTKNPNHSLRDGDSVQILSADMGG